MCQVSGTYWWWTRPGPCHYETHCLFKAPGCKWQNSRPQQNVLLRCRQVWGLQGGMKPDGDIPLSLSLSPPISLSLSIIWISNCSNTICWKNYPLSIELLVHLCQKSISLVLVYFCTWSYPKVWEVIYWSILVLSVLMRFFQFFIGWVILYYILDILNIMPRKLRVLFKFYEECL